MKYNVYSTLVEAVVFSGTHEECEEFKDKNEYYYGSLYIVSEN